jgi:cytochrome c peroxidase
VGIDSATNLGQVAITGSAAKGETPGVGNRKPQTNMYSALSPVFDPNAGAGGANAADGFGPRGGNFWDGRATGDDTVAMPGSTPHIGMEVFHDIPNEGKGAKIHEYALYFGPTTDQAFNPMQFGPEQNLGELGVCERVATRSYAQLYKKVWKKKLDCSESIAGDTGLPHYSIAFRRLMLATGAYQHSRDIMPFDSRRDRALRAELACIDYKNYKDYYNEKVCRKVEKLKKKDPTKEYGKFPLVKLTDEENLGHKLFYSVNIFGVVRQFDDPRTAEVDTLPATQCAFCHSDNPATDDGSEIFQTYTDRAWHNIGTPFNPELPHNNSGGVPIDAVADGADPNSQNYQSTDTGLRLHSGISSPGFFQTPTVRNVAKDKKGKFVKAYMHNGYFKDLYDVVHFYNTRDTLNRVPGPPFDLTCEDLGVSPAPTVEEALANLCWPDAEFRGTQSPSGVPGGPRLVGNLGLTLEEELALVAYMEALTDKHTAKKPKYK